MNMQITARGYKAPGRLKKYIIDKINRKRHVYDGVIDTEIILSYEKQIQVAEIKLNLNHKSIFVCEKTDDIFKSIDYALDNIERQINRFKQKRREHKKQKIAEKLSV
jgi:putative sigma-54 modulation protein